MNFNNFLKVFLKYFLLLQQSTLALAQILAGESTTIDKVPFIVQIYKNANFECGGSLISKYLVVTAAHCVEETPLDVLSVVGGAEKLTDEGVKSSVADVLLPKHYTRKTLHMDIAVMKLETPFTYIPKAILCSTDMKKGSTVEVFGWGMVYVGDLHASKTLRSDIFTALDYAKCIQYNKKRITKSMFCTQGYNRGVHNGDSGGPVLCDKCLCGVISSSFKLPKNLIVSVHTSLEYAKSFINKFKESSIKVQTS